MAPEERRERTEMSAAVIPEAAPMAWAAARRCCVRTDERMAYQAPLAKYEYKGVSGGAW
jgi:hypothetical protein